MPRLIAACGFGWFVALVAAASPGASPLPDSTRPAAVPPPTLADTGLFVAGRTGQVDLRNRRFSPQYPLWTDGASKTRWVFLPEGTRIDTSNPDAWELPVGTRFWKEFRFGGRPVETRFLWRASADQWVAASYIWDEDGTSASLAPADGQPGVAEVAPGRRHDVPSAQDCRACHGSSPTRPLGFNRLQLSTDRDPGAIHGEPLTQGMVTLTTLAHEGRLTVVDTSAPAPRINATKPLTRSVLGYLFANCGSCHDGSGSITGDALALSARDLMSDADAVARTMAGRPTTWRVPGAGNASVLVNTHHPDLSALLVRLRSRSPSSQMPPLGTVLRDQAAVDAVARWIATEVGGDP